MQKISDLDSDNNGTIFFSDDEINHLPLNDQKKKFPPSIWVMFRQAGSHLYVENAGGNTALSIAGRFSHHPDILEELKTMAALEQQRNPEVVFAEIVAMDNSASDNINSRGHLRDFEIPVLVHSDRAEKEIIPLNDLYIKVVNGQVILRSKRLNKIVIPRLSTAYNYRLSNLPLLRFLGDLQYQGLKTNFSFDPESYLPGLRYYPRVMYKNTILSPAKWIWDKNTIREFMDPDQGLENFHHVASVTRLTRWFALTSLDRQLVFDLNCDQSISYFLQIIRNQSKIVLQEFFLPGDSGKIYDCKGEVHLGQFVAFLINHDTVYQGKVSKQIDIIGNPKSLFLPGEQWLYFKIYAHPQTLNLLLTEGHLYTIFQRFRKRNAVHCWFFVRYADPEHHLRLRLRADARFVSQIVASINRMIKEQFKNGLIADFNIATYQPELRRYGLAGMERVEEIFELSSEAVITFYQTANAMQQQTCFAFNSVTFILSAMLPALNERLVFSEGMHRAMTKTTKRQVTLDRYYREQKHQLGLAVKHPEKYFGDPVAIEVRKLHDKCKAIANTRQLVSHERYNRFVSDLIHMHLTG